jgi:hypothetical protein
MKHIKIYHNCIYERIISLMGFIRNRIRQEEHAVNENLSGGRAKQAVVKC